MPLVNMVDMVSHAYRHNYAVGAFGVDSLEMLQGVMQAAEDSRAPVILNLIESHFSGRDFGLFAPTVVAAARRAAVPVAIAFDHGSSMAVAERAIAAGCNAVMVDTSAQPFSENLRLTREIVDMAHGCGIAVEGELGYVAGVEGESAEEHPGELEYTSAVEARTFVERSGVDCLAVSVGTVHGHMKGSPKLDYARLSKIHDAVDKPLVIHGGSGLSDDQYRRLVSHGVAKINYYTALADIAVQRVRQNAAGEGGFAALLDGVAEAVQADVERCIRIWGSGGRAAEVLTQCRPWQEIQHLVLFYTGDVKFPEQEVAALMREGRASMQHIPGVRQVRIGRALQADGKYSYCWQVTLASREAVEVFSEHPLQYAFTGKTTLALASDWQALDFAEI